MDTYQIYSLVISFSTDELAQMRWNTCNPYEECVKALLRLLSYDKP